MLPALLRMYLIPPEVHALFGDSAESLRDILDGEPRFWDGDFLFAHYMRAALALNDYSALKLVGLTLDEASQRLSENAAEVVSNMQEPFASILGNGDVRLFDYDPDTGYAGRITRHLRYESCVDLLTNGTRTDHLSEAPLRFRSVNLVHEPDVFPFLRPYSHLQLTCEQDDGSEVKLQFGMGHGLSVRHVRTDSIERGFRLASDNPVARDFLLLNDNSPEPAYGGKPMGRILTATPSSSNDQGK